MTTADSKTADSKLANRQEENNRPHVVLQVVVRDVPSSTSSDTCAIEFSAIADAVKQGIKQAVVEEERLLDYQPGARLALATTATTKLGNVLFAELHVPSAD